MSENVWDAPWLIDLEKDPDELENCYEKENYQEVVLQLKKKLLDYGTRFKDPRIKVPKIKKELKSK